MAIQAVTGDGRFTLGRGILALIAILVLGWFASAAPRQAAQVTGLAAFHRAGQTFLTWREVNAPDIPASISVEELQKIRADLQKRGVRYRIYQSLQPIQSVSGLKPVAEVPSLTAWNTEFYGNAKPKAPALRYVIEDDAAPLPEEAGLAVLNPGTPGRSYYAVTVTVGGEETRSISSSNALATPVSETVGQGIPVLQRVEKPAIHVYVDRPELRFYVRWESPPNASVEGKPYDYLIGVPPTRRSPAPVGLHLHAWGGSLMGGHGWWFNAAQGALLVATNQIPYDWWTGYHESYFDGSPRRTQDWQRGVVRPYTQRRLLSFLDWTASNFKVDTSRTFAGGISMGGSGSTMLAIRYPDRIAWSIGWVGVHRPSQSPGFKGSYAGAYGDPEWGVRFEDGTPVWDYYDDVWYLRQYPERETAFITFSNGKNDGAIGWSQAVDFARALQETKRPHLFVWGQAGHGQRAIMPDGGQGGQQEMPIDIRVNQTLPAFTNCSLDDNPGDGSPDNGDPVGQVNRYLSWATDDIVDQADRWEMTLQLRESPPPARCTVDVTPRRCQQFKVKPGDGFAWSTDGGQSGRVVADQWGLVTVPAVAMAKGNTRLRIVRDRTAGQ